MSGGKFVYLAGDPGGLGSLGSGPSPQLSVYPDQSGLKFEHLASSKYDSHALVCLANVWCMLFSLVSIS